MPWYQEKWRDVEAWKVMYTEHRNVAKETIYVQSTMRACCLTNVDNYNHLDNITTIALSACYVQFDLFNNTITWTDLLNYQMYSAEYVFLALTTF